MPPAGDRSARTISPSIGELRPARPAADGRAARPRGGRQHPDPRSARHRQDRARADACGGRRRARCTRSARQTTDGEEPSRCDRLRRCGAPSGCSRGAATACCCSTRWRICSPRPASRSSGGAAARAPRSSSTGCSRPTRCRRSGRATRSSASIRAHLRRMSYILRDGLSRRPRARARIVARVAEAEGAARPVAGLDALLPAEAGRRQRRPHRACAAAASPAAARDDAEAVGRSLLLGLRGGRALAPAPDAAGSTSPSMRPIGRSRRWSSGSRQRARRAISRCC